MRWFLVAYIFIMSRSRNQVVPFKKGKKQTSSRKSTKTVSPSSSLPPERTVNAAKTSRSKANLFVVHSMDSGPSGSTPRSSVGSNATAHPSNAACRSGVPSSTPKTAADTTSPRPSMAHMFVVGPGPLPPPSSSLKQRDNRVSVASNSSSASSQSDSSALTNASMENQLSRSGGGSSRRISSPDLDQSHSSKCGEGQLGVGLGHVGGAGGGGRGGAGGGSVEDYLDNFPYTRPGNPVRTNGLSIWKNSWR